MGFLKSRGQLQDCPRLFYFGPKRSSRQARGRPEAGMNEEASAGEEVVEN